MLAAEPVRVAVYNVELDREGPGLLLRDIQRGAEDAAAVARVVRAAAVDVLLLTRFDYDRDLVALRAFNALLEAGAYPHLFALRPNTGRATGLDLNRNGRLGEPEDAQSYGQFAGQNGMAILSRYPIDLEGVRDFTNLLWRDLPGARLPVLGDDPFWGPEVLSVLRLSTTGHWDVPILVGEVPLHVLAFHASPPVFDGPEDRGGLRAADELRLWSVYLDGGLGLAPPERFVILGTANIDPDKGDGHRAAMAAVLADPRLQDPRPASPGAAAQGAATDTVDWSGPGEPGNLRVDYVLPAAPLRVTGAGVIWPAPDDPSEDILGAEGRAASRHRLVWVDLQL